MALKRALRIRADLRARVVQLALVRVHTNGALQPLAVRTEALRALQRRLALVDALLAVAGGRAVPTEIPLVAVVRTVGKAVTKFLNMNAGELIVAGGMVPRTHDALVAQFRVLVAQVGSVRRRIAAIVVAVAPPSVRETFTCQLALELLLVADGLLEAVLRLVTAVRAVGIRVAAPFGRDALAVPAAEHVARTCF